MRNEAWTCWDADNGEQDDAYEVWALDAEDAAERLAARHYSDEPFESATIAVLVGGTAQTFRVSATPSVSFVARLVPS